MQSSTYAGNNTWCNSGWQIARAHARSAASGDGVVTYGAFAHPELSPSPNTLVVSYDVSPLGPAAGTITDASIYRPRFLDVTFS